ncbi:MAG: DUF6428 family protein [Verrucomicrobiota bacterium]|nr:DUF6428 family protein [Verrucomicrobiota bacterium]
MKLRELKSLLRANPDACPRLILPNGDTIPSHFHITEVGHVAKKFIDCGGTLHDTTHTCLLQTYVADDLDHRVKAGTFAKILDLGDQVLPHDDLEVEVEYDCCVVAQYPIATAKLAGEFIELRLGEKHADCLAKEKCGIDGRGCGSDAETDATIVGTLAATVATCC